MSNSKENEEISWGSLLLLALKEHPITTILLLMLPVCLFGTILLAAMYIADRDPAFADSKIVKTTITEKDSDFFGYYLYVKSQDLPLKGAELAISSNQFAYLSPGEPVCVEYSYREKDEKLKQFAERLVDNCK